MKGLMFTLLDKIAKRAGCSDEAWELVMEFAAAEALVEEQHELDGAATTDTARFDRFDVPTEAMLNCLSRERSVDSEWEEPPPPSSRQLEPRAMTELLCDAFRHSVGGFGQNAFRSLGTRILELEQLEDELDDEKLEAEWNRYPPRSEPPSTKGR